MSFYSDNTLALKKHNRDWSIIALVYYILFALFFNIHSMHSTMFFQEHLLEYNDVFVKIYDVATNVLFALSLITIIRGSNKLSIKVSTITIIALCFLYDHFRDITTNRTLTVYLLLIVSSQRKSLKCLCKLFLIIGWGWVIAGFIGYKLGYLTDITLGDRHAFGSIYCTDLACHLLTLIMALCVLRNGKLKLYEYFTMILLMIINVLYLKAKVGLICMSLVLIVTAYYQFIVPRIKTTNCKAVEWVCIASFSLLATITLIMTLKYTPDPNRFLNKYHFLGTFKSRFYEGRIAFDQYKVNLWGTYIVEHGNGGIVGGRTDDYFFIDISYIRILMLNGIVIFLLMMLLFTALQVRLFKGKSKYLMIIVSIFLLDCAVEHHMLEIAYDFFPFMLFCNLDTVIHEKISPQSPAPSAVQCNIQKITR